MKNLKRAVPSGWPFFDPGHRLPVCGEALDIEGKLEAKLDRMPGKLAAGCECGQWMRPGVRAKRG